MVTCKFSCSECGVTDAIVQVPPRPLEMDVRRWVVDVVGLRVDEQHRMLSPNCKAKTMSALKIPFPRDDPDGWIGKQTDEIPPDGESR